MDTKIYRIYETLITIAIGIILAVTAIFGIYYLTIVVLLAGMILLYIFKKKSETEDERIIKIREKASKRTLQIFGVGIATFGFILMSYLDQKLIGFVLVYSVFILWVLYLICFDYYLRKYGD
jgi:uncharacterized membrane protein